MAWSTIRFCEGQQLALDTHINREAAKDPAAVHLIQMPGIGATLAMTILAAIGDIARFKSPKKLVGYTGLGARVRQTNNKIWRGPLMCSGRKELRWAMVQAAMHAVRSDDRWKRAYDALLPRIGKYNARVAIARRMLITVWYLLSRGETDRAADAEHVAQSLVTFAYDAGVDNLPEKNAAQFVRNWLNELGIGAELTHVKNGSKNIALPPSTLPGAPSPDAVVEKHSYPPFGCASIRAAPDSRTFEGRLLSGRSKPEGAKKKRPLVGPRKKVATPNPTG